MAPDDILPDTRTRLLAAARSVFAESGFHRATVRDICQRAEANVAAINYHFGDKLGLYREVLRDSYERLYERYSGDSPEDMAPEERLHVFVEAFLQRAMAETQDNFLMRIMFFEMQEPTAALEDIIQQTVRPRWDRLGIIVAAIGGPAITPQLLDWCRMSIVSQCIFPKLGCQMLQRLAPDHMPTRGDIPALARHITMLCLAGLRGYRNGAEATT